MFADPRWIMRQGRVINPRGDLISISVVDHLIVKRTYLVRPEPDRWSIARLTTMHAAVASFAFENPYISEDELATRIGGQPTLHSHQPRR